MKTANRTASPNIKDGTSPPRHQMLPVEFISYSRNFTTNHH